MATVPFLERIKQPQPLLADGAMATQLHKRGIPMNACFDTLNLTQPDLISEIHRDYILSGAQILETNTFGANRLKLGEHGYADRVREINLAGAQLALSAVEKSLRDDVYVAGSVGPLGQRMRPYGFLNKDDVKHYYTEQITALIDGGVDVLLFETFADHTMLLVAIETAQAISPDTPIIAQATFAGDDRTLPGFTPSKVAYDLYKSGVSVVGVNCSAGPSQIAGILQAMHDSVPEAKFSVMPNAGFPETVSGRVMYPASADYFGDYALTFQAIGANIIGGCCGTTPEHITAMRKALDDVASHKRVLPDLSVVESGNQEAGSVKELPTDLARRLEEHRFTITVEMAPPRSYDVEKLLKNARLLRDAGANILDIADTPAARMRMSPWGVSQLIQSHIGVETVLHFPTRGRNLLRIQGDLLAAHAMGLRNLFVTMGDPTKIGDYPDAMDSYDIVPSKLIDLIKHDMNAGRDQAGNSIGSPTSFTVGCALNMFADDLEREIRVLGNKLAAGADFALGQAVFEPHRIDTFLETYEQITEKAFNLPVLIGIMPLYSLKHAQFLHNEVPGISIPEQIMKRMEDAGDDAPKEGVRIAQELLGAVRDRVQGAYVIPAFGKYHLAAEVVDFVAVSK